MSSSWQGLTMFSGSSFFTVILEEHIVWAFYLIPVGTLLLICLCQWILFRKSCLTEKERGHYIKFWEGGIVKWIHLVQNLSDLTLSHLFNLFSSYDNCVMDGVWEFRSPSSFFFQVFSLSSLPLHDCIHSQNTKTIKVSNISLYVNK